MTKDIYYDVIIRLREIADKLENLNIVDSEISAQYKLTEVHTNSGWIVREPNGFVVYDIRIVAEEADYD